MKACIHLGFSTVTVTKETLTVTANQVLEGNTCAKQNLPKTTAVTHRFLRPATGYGRDRMVRTRCPVKVSTDRPCRSFQQSLQPVKERQRTLRPFAAETLTSATPTTGGQRTTGATVAQITSAHKGGTDVRQCDCSHKQFIS